MSEADTDKYHKRRWGEPLPPHRCHPGTNLSGDREAPEGSQERDRPAHRVPGQNRQLYVPGTGGLDHDNPHDDIRGGRTRPWLIRPYGGSIQGSEAQSSEHCSSENAEQDDCDAEESETGIGDQDDWMSRSRSATGRVWGWCDR